MKYSSRLPDESVNYSKDSLLIEALYLLLGLALIVALTYAALGLAIDLIVPYISPAYEQQVFKSLVKVLPAPNPKYRNAEMTMQKIVDKMLAGSPVLNIPLHVRIIESEQENAAALPGGFIIISDSLLKNSHSENEIAMVLGHEIGHFAHRHHLRGLGRGLLGAVIFYYIAGVEPNGSGMLSLPLQLTALTYSRAQEEAADELGLDLLNAVYGHTAGAADFFERAVKKDHLSGIPGIHLFSTHPLSEQRVLRLRKLAQDKGYSLSGSLKPVVR